MIGRTTKSAKLCFKGICDIVRDKLKCGGNTKESPEWLCKMCPMHYNVYDLDDEESTECRIKDMKKHLDWIDNDFYLVVERNAENGGPK